MKYYTIVKAYRKIIAVPGDGPGSTAIARGSRGYLCEVHLRGLVDALEPVHADGQMAFGLW